MMLIAVVTVLVTRLDRQMCKEEELCLWLVVATSRAVSGTNKWMRCQQLGRRLWEAVVATTLGREVISHRCKMRFQR